MRSKPDTTRIYTTVPSTPANSSSRPPDSHSPVQQPLPPQKGSGSGSLSLGTRPTRCSGHTPRKGLGLRRSSHTPSHRDWTHVVLMGIRLSFDSCSLHCVVTSDGDHRICQEPRSVAVRLREGGSQRLAAHQGEPAGEGQQHADVRRPTTTRSSATTQPPPTAWSLTRSPQAAMD